MTTPQTNEVAPQDMAEALAEFDKELRSIAVHRSTKYFAGYMSKKTVATIRAALSGSREKELMECIADLAGGLSKVFYCDHNEELIDVIDRLEIKNSALIAEAKNRKA